MITTTTISFLEKYKKYLAHQIQPPIQKKLRILNFHDFLTYQTVFANKKRKANNYNNHKKCSNWSENFWTNNFGIDCWIR